MNVKNKEVSIYSVAKKAKVSPATVSRVLNQSASVNLATRQKVLDVIEQLGFRPRQARNKPGQIGFVMIRELAMMDHYTSSIMEGIMNFCSEAGLDLSTIHMTPEQADSEMVVKTIMEHSCDVVILIGKNDNFLKFMRKASIPVILVGDKVEADGVHYVDTNNRTGTRDAMEYLVKQGHQRIALFCANMSSEDHIDRLAVYKEVLAENDIEFDDSLIVPMEFKVPSMEAGKLMAAKFFDSEPDATAILAMCDELVYGMLREMHDRGIKVPEDVALIGFDDYEMSQYIEPPLTTVRQPLFEMGEYSARAAMKLINKAPGNNISKILPAKLVVRKST